jgi:DNA-binding transcriptional ArsR family regulator
VHSPTDDLADLRAVFSADVRLSAPERAVMLALILHRNGRTGRTDPSVTSVAAEIGVSRRTVMRALGTLEAAGMIERDMRAGIRTRYIVHPPTSATVSPVPESHQCQPDTGPVPLCHGTGATVSPERTKNERKNERVEVSPLWQAYVEELDGTRLQLTDGRRKALERLHDEQLKRHPEPLALFRALLAAVKASEYHMSNRDYQMPESLFRNSERRERWTMKGLDLLTGNGKNGAAHDPLMMTPAELRR